MRTFRIYFDACTINRLSDDQSQARVRHEAQAVERILGLVLTGTVRWMASRTLETELLQNPNPGKLNASLRLLLRGHPLAVANEAVRQRGADLASLGYGAFDALHLAHGEDSRVDVLLTTDDRFIRQASRGLGNPLISDIESGRLA